MDTPDNHPLSGALDHWDSVVTDMSATAEEYQNNDWATLELSPGGVMIDTELPGFDVLVPDNEFNQATTLLEGGVDSYQVYLGVGNGVVFAVLALEDSTAQHAVLAPLYYLHGTLDELRAHIADNGLSTRLRTLDKTEFVVNHEDASLFFPANK
jgi:hypothetical protein